MTHRNSLPTIDASSFDAGAGNTPERDEVAELIDATCGAHTDYGTVTVLADDGIGGLQVMKLMGTWIEVSVPADAMVVNIGDLMAVWTNDRWVSNPHPMLNPPDTDCYSMPLFVTPPFHAMISCLPSCLADGETARYEPQEAGPYLLSRFDATHSYRNPLLAQINH